MPRPPGSPRSGPDARCAQRASTTATALAYLAAYDVHRACVFGRCEPSTGIKPFTTLVDQVIQIEPYASATRLHDTYPNAQMLHLPVHAPWLNQVEVYLSVLQRKLLTPDDFKDLDELATQILAFEKHYNDAARPFD